MSNTSKHIRKPSKVNTADMSLYDDLFCAEDLNMVFNDIERDEVGSEMKKR